jgi:hypothetical protein
VKLWHIPLAFIIAVYCGNALAENALLPMSMSEKDRLMDSTSKCWAVPIQSAPAPVVGLTIDVNIDGSIKHMEFTQAQELQRYQKDKEFRAFADAAVSAVKKCGPQAFASLPKDKYETWKHIEMTFDPAPLQIQGKLPANDTASGVHITQANPNALPPR